MPLFHGEGLFLLASLSDHDLFGWEQIQSQLGWAMWNSQISFGVVCSY